MSNSRRLRRGPADDGTQARAPVHSQSLPRFPHKAPALGTVRGWLRQLEAAGDAERDREAFRTGKPGRPPHGWKLTEQGEAKAASAPPRRAPPDRDEARKILDQACREELRIGGRVFVRRLDAGYYECGWRCACTVPHDPGLRMLLRAAAWSRMSVRNASRPDPR